MKIAQDWKDYEILDMANGEKLDTQVKETIITSKVIY